MRIWMISPCPYDQQHGGVQKAGQVAWEGIQSSPFFQDSQMLCYGATCDTEHSRRDASSLVCSQSKLGAIGSTFSLHRPADLILFWHVGMLKLLPVLRPGKARIALFVHGIECWEPLSGLVGRQLAKVDMALCVSRFSMDRTIEANPVCGQMPSRIVPLGVDEPDLSPVPPLERPPAVLIVSRMSRLEAYKGHRELIEAWPKVLQAIPDAELWIAGSGDLQPELEALAAQRGGRSIRFYGSISSDAKLDLLRRCRCFAMPSPKEGFGLVYLEAMRAGRPCLVNRTGAGVEVVNPPEAGLAANPQDPADLAATLTRLLRPGEEWNGWSERARKRYNACFTERHFQERLLQALQEAATRKLAI